MNWYKRAMNILDCSDCGKSVLNEGYMLKDNVWDSIADKKTNLCVDCCEKRLGRKLNKEDFQDIGYNFWKDMKPFKSTKLIDRLGI